MRYSEQEKARHIRDWRTSGLSKGDFSRQQGQSPSTFYYWTRDLEEEHAAFTRLVVKDTSALRVTLPHGTTLELSADDEHQLASILLAIDRQYA